MNKKVVVLGGGTGQSGLLKGLKRFPFDITAVVAVSDDGRSTGILRNEFNTPAVGDVRRVIIALSETEDAVEKLVDYRFDRNNSFKGHAVGNIILTALCEINGSLSKGVKSISNLLNLKGKVIPLTDESVTLSAIMEDGSEVIGEHSITKCDKKIKSIRYVDTPVVNSEVVKSIKKADALILSMGSLYTSIIPNLLCPEVIEAIDNSNVKVIYACNIMTQPGESDNFKVSDHVNLLNSYLGNKKIDFVIANNGIIDEELKSKYYREEQKDPVIVDEENIECILVDEDLVCVEDNCIRHDSLKLAYKIYGYLTGIIK